MSSKLITHPLFAAANFAGSIVLFYYSDAFGYAMRDHVGHELMNLHFALTGYIFVLTMIGTDPLPRRAPYPMRLLLLLATMGFHAFFGVAIMGGTGLLAADYFGNLGRTWGTSALLDQQMGGAVAWGIGEVPTLLVAIGVAVQWSRADARESKRVDRAADRNNDADLTAYNDMFAASWPNAMPGWPNAIPSWKDAHDRNRTRRPPGPGPRAGGPRLAEHRRQGPGPRGPARPDRRARLLDLLLRQLPARPRRAAAARGEVRRRRW